MRTLQRISVTTYFVMTGYTDTARSRSLISEHVYFDGTIHTAVRELQSSTVTFTSVRWMRTSHWSKRST